MPPKLPTPSTTHLNFSTIYEPAEDSFLFLDTLSSAGESDFLTSRFATSQTQNRLSSRSSPPLVLEVGTGSGVIIAFVTAHALSIFGRGDVCTIGVDVNLDACRGTAETVRKAVEEVQNAGLKSRGDGSTSETATSATTLREHGLANGRVTDPGLYLGNICSNLTTSLQSGSVDVLLFNPPYVPTENLPDPAIAKHRDRFDEESHLLALSYAGGVDGMEVTERLLNQLPHVLSAKGVAYILFCARNKPQEALGRIMQGPTWDAGQGWEWATEVAGKTGGKGGWERLEIWRIWRRWEHKKPET